MDQEMNALGMLDLMVRPGFCVKDGKILKCNSSARSVLLAEEMDIFPMLATGETEYRAFTGGTLYLTLELSGARWGASVTRMGDCDVFLLEEETDRSELQAMALAARELRVPLASLMTTADRLFPLEALEDDPKLREQAARLNRGLHQMLRIIGNMSDAESYAAPRYTQMEILEAREFFGEIFEKNQALMEHTGLTLRFENLERSLYTLADKEKLERAVLNMLSNAMKFTPPGGTIEARLTHRGRQLYLTVQDSGEGIADALRGSIHHRYLRQPGIEDSRFGIGLGMVLIRSAAAAHGGTVLIDHPEGAGTRITMTMVIRQDSSGNVRTSRTSNFLTAIDYAGGRDHSLLELSEHLPHTLYEEI
jgi:signal transduction histidine kinase